jgi:PAS domain S-box-containing protein
MAQNHKMNFRIIRDISKQTRLEENLKENQKHLQTIINNTPDAVYLKNSKGQYLLTNNKFESLFNLSNQQVKGKTDLELFPKDLANTFSENESQVLNTGKKIELQTTIIHEDGVHTYHSINFPLKHSHSNVPYGMCGILKDITQNANLSKELNKYKNKLEQMVEKRTANLKLAQKKFIRSEKLTATNQLATKVSDQINNSIFGIRNILEQINDRASLEEMHKDLVGLGVKECNRIEDFITNLQKSHTPDQGKVGPVDLHKIIDGIVETTEKEMKEKNIVLEKRLASDIPTFKGVSDQITQMIANIMQNAQESLSKDNGKILIATDRDEGNIKITIQDTGCGIPPENMSAIFDPFFTTKSAINRPGMGLLLSLGIVKGHKGDIDVNSKPGAGTTFTITLPVDS